MGWERQKPTVAPMPDEPSLMLWLMLGVVALVGSILLFMLHASQLLGVLQQYNPWLLFAAPLAICFTLVCLRGWIYNQAYDRHQFESDEAEYAQMEWSAWAERYLAVLHSMVLLPDALTAAQLVPASSELEQRCKQARRIQWQEIEGLEILLAEISDALHSLPAGLIVNVTLLTDSVRDTTSLQDEFSALWQRIISDKSPEISVNIQHAKSLLVLEERLKSSEVSAELILVEQLHGGANYSDALAVLLLTTDDVSTKYQLEHSSRLLRPMSLESKRQYDELVLFFSTQTQANSTQFVIGDSAEHGCSLIELLNASESSGGKWRADQLFWLEKYAGISGPLSPWVLAAFTCDVVALQQANCLMLSEDRELRFINTVTTGNKDESNR